MFSFSYATVRLREASEHATPGWLCRRLRLRDKVSFIAEIRFCFFWGRVGGERRSSGKNQNGRNTSCTNRFAGRCEDGSWNCCSMNEFFMSSNFCLAWWLLLRGPVGTFMSQFPDQIWICFIILSKWGLVKIPQRTRMTSWQIKSLMYFIFLSDRDTTVEMNPCLSACQYFYSRFTV